MLPNIYVFCWLPEKFEHMKKTGDYYVVVVEDTNLRQIVATATLITEHKFIHSCAKVSDILADNLFCVYLIMDTVVILLYSFP